MTITDSTGYLANAARQVMQGKTEEERQQSLSKRHWRLWLKDIGILGEYIVEKPHTFLTMRITSSLPAFYKQVIEDLGKLKSLSGARLVFEGGNTSNPHIHMLMEGKRHKANTIKTLSKKFKISKEKVDFKSSDDAELYYTRLAYITGAKKDEKEKKVQDDIKYREQHGIQHLYEIH